MKFIFIHGFNTSETGHLIRMNNEFNSRGLDFRAFSYGNLSYFGVRLANANIAAALLSYVELIAAEGPVTLIGHSNGCALIVRLLANAGLGLVDRVIFLSPALNTKTSIPPGPRAVDVFFSGKDRVVELASLLPWHEWGAMGARGYRGKEDARVRNHNFTGMIAHHSDWFLDVPWLVDRILEDKP